MISFVSNFIYLTLNGESPPNFNTWFVYNHNIHSYATRNDTHIINNDYFDPGTVEPSTSLRPFRSNLVNYGDKLIKVNGPKIWNDLPDTIRESTSIFTFKLHLKTYFISKYNGHD